MEKEYVAYLVIDNERVRVEFSTSIRPVEWLWQRYGMSTFIESVQEAVHEGVIQIEAEQREEEQGGI